MVKSVLTISVTSFGAGIAVQFVLCALYISAVIEPGNPALWMLLAAYLASGTLGIGGLLYFTVAAPLLFILLWRLRQEEPGFYPLTAMGVCVGLSAWGGSWMGGLDWRLFALMVPSAFFFGGMWWNRIELNRSVRNKLAA
ncbi:hypothetical protein C8P63_104193 [Melghirimyces profundicolus]|uniref:Uncharacterized protein n=1 Tax=Melghirimyces profundicolus TaxID=1242148 RepID=A0A2T6C4V2_9BACL|nr:hypothetical protein [Melghirimyces profundicolus]PTX63346.1 hypothetical protein C8P63_104193 [Melghirimyces profundicolus]